MGFKEIVAEVLRRVGEQPLIAAGLAAVFAIMVLLGGLHVFRILGRFLIVLLQEVKHEVVGLGRVLWRVKRELTSWNVDE